MKRMMALHLLLGVSLCAPCLFAACGRDASESGEGPSRPRVESTQAMTASAAQSVSARAAEEVVSFRTGDGVIIAGTLYPAASSAPTVLCLHEWRGSRADFASFARELQAAGMTVLAIDMRGYGGSTRRADGGTVEPDRITTADIEAAMGFLRGHASVDRTRIGLLGASYGSSNAIIYAAAQPSVKAVALLSPGLNYHKVLPTEDAVRAYGNRPALAIAGSEDMRSVEAVTRYARISGSGLQTKLFDNGGHGIELLRSQPGCRSLVIEFFKKNL